MPIFEHKEKIKDIEFIIKDSSNHRSKSGHAGSSIKVEPQIEVSKPKIDQSVNKQITKKSTPVKKKSSIVDDFSIPMPKIKSLTSSSSGMNRKYGVSGGHSTSSASSTSGENGNGNGVGNSTGSGSGSGSGFDKVSTRKIVSAYDIGPYVSELKRNIRWNWKNPKSGENKNVELFLRIAKDGKLIILNVKRTSEVAEVDEAALNAVRKTLPLNPLPVGYKKSYLDVIFSFSSNSSSLSSRY